jgi:hypothetical protein
MVGAVALFARKGPHHGELAGQLVFDEVDRHIGCCHP